MGEKGEFIRYILSFNEIDLNTIQSFQHSKGYKYSEEISNGNDIVLNWDNFLIEIFVHTLLPTLTCLVCDLIGIGIVEDSMKLYTLLVALYFGFTTNYMMMPSTE